METWLCFSLLLVAISDVCGITFEARLLLPRENISNKTGNSSAIRKQVFATRKSSFLKPNGDEFIVHKPGLMSVPGTVSFESKRLANYYLRYKNYRFHLEDLSNNTANLMKKDSTFREVKHQSLPGTELLELSGHPEWFVCRDPMGKGLAARKRDLSETFKNLCSLQVAATVGSSTVGTSKAAISRTLPQNKTTVDPLNNTSNSNATLGLRKQILPLQLGTPLKTHPDDTSLVDFNDSPGTALEEYLPEHSNILAPVVTDVKTKFKGCANALTNCSLDDESSLRVIKHGHHLLETEDAIDKANFEKQVIDERKDKCINLILTNHFGGRYRIVSDVNPTGYKPKGIQFSLKTVFKNPSAHKVVRFRAIYDLDEAEALLLNGEKQLIAIPAACTAKPTPVAVTAKSSRDADTVFAVKRKLRCQRVFGVNTSRESCCHFPFVYNNIVFTRCTGINENKPWCSLTGNFDRDKRWGYCMIPTIPDPDDKRNCPSGCKNNAECTRKCPKRCCSSSNDEKG